MTLDVKLRKEGPEDTRPVECLLREAFWNVYVPGCEEHYLAHILRKHRDFASGRWVCYRNISGTVWVASWWSA